MQAGPELRYWKCRGRAQPLVYLLEDSGLAYSLHEHELPVGERAEEAWNQWQTAKADKSLSGPFGQLPLLRWGETSLAQTHAIARYLGRRLGYFPASSLEEEARCDMYLSAAFQDLHLPLMQLFYTSVGTPEGNLAAAVEGVKGTIDGALERFEDELKEQGRHYLLGGDKPTVPDFFLFEALDLYASGFGAAHLKDKFPALAAFRERISDRDRIKAYLASGKRHARFTASPAEEEIFQAMHDLTKKP